MPDYDVYSLPRDGEADQTLDTRKMALALWRGKLLLAAFAGAGFLAGLAHVSQQEPVYRAVTSILYEPERLQIVDISEVLVEPDTGAGIGNQVEILNSTTLLGNIVSALGEDTILQDRQDGGGAPETGRVWNAAAAWLLDAAPDSVSSQLEWLGFDAQADAAGDAAPAQTEEEAQKSAARDAISYLRGNLEIEVISGSGVIELFYHSSDPEKAALIANTISEEYITFQKVSKNQDVLAAIDLVSNRIEELRQSVVASERNLENTRLDLARRRAQSAEMTGIQLAAHNQELAAIRLRLSESRARFERAAAALAEGTDLWSVTEFRESELITDFRRREMEIRETIAQERAISGSVVTPSSVRSAALLEQAQQSIREEAAYIVAALEFEVASLEQREQQLEQMVRELEITSIERTADELFISRLEREVLANQTLLQTFVVRQKEISEQANLQSADARILSRAEPPSHPDRQASNRVLLASSGGALFLCALFLLLRERMNNSVRDPRDLAEITHYPLLTSLPLTGRRKSLHKRAREFMTRPKCLLAESIRNLRTSLLYSDPDNQPQVIMLTSSVPGEGKSVTSFLTALASQHTEHDTILVSCDLRDASNARIYSKFPRLVPSKSSTGLVGYLRNDCSLEEALAVHPESGLHILAAGKREHFHESPADILSSPKFTRMIAALRERYKLVILDAPPVLVAADARLLSRMADSVVYLVHWNRTSKNAVREGLRELRSVNSPVAGCVLSMVSQSKARRYADNEFIYKQHYAGYYS